MFTKATFLRKNNESEGSPDESCDDSDTSSDNESSTNMYGDGKIETNKKKELQQNDVSKLPDTQLVPLNFDDIDLNSWVLVLYEGKKNFFKTIWNLI